MEFLVFKIKQLTVVAVLITELLIIWNMLKQSHERAVAMDEAVFTA